MLRCVTDTVFTTTTKSYIAHASKMNLFSCVAEIGDYTWMENKGGLKLLLKPIQSSCMAIYQGNHVF